MLTPVEIRAKIVEAVELDLIGPSHDHAFARELLPESPENWYLTGFIVPKNAPLDQKSDASDDEELDIETKPSAVDDDNPPDHAPRKSMLPSSIGLSVLVPAAVRRLRITTSWGDYRAETEEDRARASDARDPMPKDESVKGWRRIPRSVMTEIDLPEEDATLEPVPVSESGGLQLIVTSRRVVEDSVRRSLGAGTRSVSVFIVNDRVPQVQAAFETFAFQVGLSIDVDHSFVSRPDLRDSMSKESGQETLDEQIAELQYRDVFEYAVGHGVSATWTTDEQGGCKSVRSTWVPCAQVERVEPRAMENVELGMERLGELSSGEDAERKLAPLVREYREWIEAQEARKSDLTAQSVQTLDHLAVAARSAERRIQNGINCLRDPNVLEAFKIANRAMAAAARQREWAAGDRTKPASELAAPRWRPFQIAYILLNLEGVAKPEHEDRKCVDLLFFPTGGGKTEAYLGLAAFTMVYRRLKNPGVFGCGLSVLMRYTLRLLTLDQLGRAAGLICALELERKLNPRLGSWPFEIGLWVGQAATPNRLGHRGYKGPGADHTAYSKLMKFKQQPEQHPSPIPIENCPWCGTKFSASSFALFPNDAKPVDLRVRCTNHECQFSGDHALPIVAVDEPIYRRLPAFMIATVDKFASLPWTGQTGSLFGKVTHHDEHGFYGPCDRTDGKALGRPLLPPDLIIQDELHLISGPLGTIAGVYEAAIERLCTRTAAGTVIQPKIIASTATVRMAAAQIRALFNRITVSIFPPPGPDRTDSFFAITVPPDQKPARHYVGLAAQGRSAKVLLLRASLAALGAAAAAYEQEGGRAAKANPADAYMTLLGYFNSLRELGGSRRIMEDEVRTRLQRYNDRKRLAPEDHLFINRNIAYEPLELTSRVSTDEVADAKRRLALAHHESEHVDTALATNMISVGLDITRLGLMMVHGQPKTTSEYIQATSRVGRSTDRPGLVITLLNIHKPRDRSHFERFEGYHNSFYRSVEATSVTPFSPRALDRALAGALVAMCRHELPELTPSVGASKVAQHMNKLSELVKYLADRAQASAMSKSEEESAALREQVKQRTEKLLDNWVKIIGLHQENGVNLHYQREEQKGAPLLWGFLDPELADQEPIVRSFRANRSMRDVEPSVELSVRKLHSGGGRS